MERGKVNLNTAPDEISTEEGKNTATASQATEVSRLSGNDYIRQTRLALSRDAKRRRQRNGNGIGYDFMAGAH